MIGQTVSHYRILSKLGEGGMGTVYVAEDTLLGRRVAIKSLKIASVPGQTHFRTRFLREARAASLLNHPHIATVHDYGETEDGRPYLVMELIDGQGVEIDQSGYAFPDHKRHTQQRTNVRSKQALWRARINVCMERSISSTT